MILRVMQSYWCELGLRHMRLFGLAMLGVMRVWIAWDCVEMMGKEMLVLYGYFMGVGGVEIGFLEGWSGFGGRI